MTEPASITTIAPPADTRRIRWARATMAATSWIYVGAILVQVFLAGLFVFSGLSIQFHREFAHLFAVLAITQLVAVALGRFPRSVSVLAIGLTLLLLLQGALILLRPISPVIAAFHPVNAIVMAWTSVVLARRAAAFAPRLSRPTRRASTAAPEAVSGGAVLPARG